MKRSLMKCGRKQRKLKYKINQPVPDCKYYQAGRVLTTGFEKQVITMAFHCTDTDKKFFSNFSIAEFFANKVEYLSFAIGNIDIYMTYVFYPFVFFAG